MNDILSTLYPASGGDATRVRTTPFNLKVSSFFDNFRFMNIPQDQMADYIVKGNITFVWNFDDPYWADGTDNDNVVITQMNDPVTHTYHRNGTYFVKMTVKAGTNCITTTKKIELMNNEAPTATPWAPAVWAVPSASATFNDVQNVYLYTNVPSATIYYTLDGSEPELPAQEIWYDITDQLFWNTYWGVDTSYYDGTDWYLTSGAKIELDNHNDWGSNITKVKIVTDTISSFGINWNQSEGGYDYYNESTVYKQVIADSQNAMIKDRLSSMGIQNNGATTKFHFYADQPASAIPQQIWYPASRKSYWNTNYDSSATFVNNPDPALEYWNLPPGQDISMDNAYNWGSSVQKIRITAGTTDGFTLQWQGRDNSWHTYSLSGQLVYEFWVSINNGIYGYFVNNTSPNTQTIKIDVLDEQPIDQPPQ